jgi:hypothetical protein
MSQAKKYCYIFSENKTEGDKSMKLLIGGKGTNILAKIKTILFISTCKK